MNDFIEPEYQNQNIVVTDAFNNVVPFKESNYYGYEDGDEYYDDENPEDESEIMMEVKFGGGILIIAGPEIMPINIDERLDCRYADIISLSDDVTPGFLYFNNFDDITEMDMEFVLDSCSDVYDGFEDALDQIMEDKHAGISDEPAVYVHRVRTLNDILENDKLEMGMPFIIA